MTPDRIATLLRAPLLIGAFVSCMLGGCAPAQSKPAFEVEVESIEQQASNEIEKAPLKFTKDITEDPVTWGRAKAFLEKVLETEAKITKDGRMVWGEAGSFRYAVRRRYTKSTVTYEVYCETLQGSQDARAIGNARNLSRFMRDGTLELSLLNR